MNQKRVVFLAFLVYTLLMFTSCASVDGTVVQSDRGTITVSSLTVDQEGLFPGTFRAGTGQLMIEYPERCYSAGIEGVVEIFVDIHDDGEVVQARVTRGIGGGCDEAALEAVRESLFNPAIDTEGTPVTARHTIQVTFSTD